jgi:hypothetical protein
VLLRVTDQGSGEGVDFSTLRPLTAPPFEAPVGEVVCRFCGRRGLLIDPFTG